MIARLRSSPSEKEGRWPGELKILNKTTTQPSTDQMKYRPYQLDHSSILQPRVPDEAAAKKHQQWKAYGANTRSRKQNN